MLNEKVDCAIGISIASYPWVYVVTDIEDIQALGNIGSTEYCSWGTEIVPLTMVVMEIKPEEAKELLLPIYYRCCSLPLVLTFHCTEDTSNFVKAVKNTTARE